MSPAYRTLIECLMASMPHTGWQRTTDIPALSHLDLADVVREHPSVLDDLFPRVGAEKIIASALREHRRERYMRLGLLLQLEIERGALEILLTDLQAAADDAAEFRGELRRELAK